MTVKVYGLAISPPTRRVLATLEEKSVDYELIIVDVTKGAHKAPDFLAKQPFGQIPVLEDGDIRIFESRAIARYIATKWADQGTDLLGKDAKAKALTETWLEVESSTYNPPAAILLSEKLFKPMFGGVGDDAVIAAQIEKLDKVLDTYEGVLSKQQYLTGDHFTLADLSHLPYTAYLLHAGLLTATFDRHPSVKAWWERISSRPVWQKVAAQHTQQ